MNNPEELSTPDEPENDVIRAVSFMLEAHKNDMPREKLSNEMRILCVVELNTQGHRPENIASIMGVCRTTVYNCMKRYADLTANIDMSQHVNTTAEAIQRKFDLLWEKAIKAGELNVARLVERDRVLLLQSMGIVHKLADKAEIKIESADVRPKAEVIDVIARRIKSLGLGHKKGNGPKGGK